ncbi:hypothetical protein MNQ98_16995 [Paenibacillus sp. N3/727]|uniref:hypothetical protein n=1 Tax=Paenibacillus sp. N3/727 TaxID=2925845 RepID=UPI001F535531|nr:hypothetical protein [Paenibacillus sp. N3/727]UNK16218.1 hypothetical protein MNQ98_16995 [Paenibacillus sp. N3/727]
MNNLQTAIQLFLHQQDLYNQQYGLFKDHHIQWHSAPAAVKVDERIELSPELMYFYEHCEMMDPNAQLSHKVKNAAVEIGDSAVLFFAAPDHLDRYQQGFRWVGQHEPYEESDRWDRSLVVIALLNDDPIAVNTALPGSPVYASWGGDPAPIAASMADFFEALALLIEAARAMQGDLVDEETCEVKELFLQQVEPKLRSLLSDTCTRQLFRFLSFCE